MPPPPINKSNVYSQFGEDGIIDSIFNIIPDSDGYCVEFGAADGIWYSNTKNLIENRDYSAVLIEGSKSEFDKLKSNYSGNSNVVCLNKFVGFSKEDNLDKILKEDVSFSVPHDFDFLSIDIDGNDYHVWDALLDYQPKVVCIEVNPTIPTGIEFVQPADMKLSQGSSITSMVKLGKKKGYELVYYDGNAFFVKNKYFPLFKIKDNSPEKLRKYYGAITSMFLGMDGMIFIHGMRKFIWQGMSNMGRDNIKLFRHSQRKKLAKIYAKYDCIPIGKYKEPLYTKIRELIKKGVVKLLLLLGYDETLNKRRKINEPK